ncbi:MAG: PHB depolymerase family esterase [Alphaproteobacteria bacterium]|nr:PHB depolymerase family esterase [Alphaproteobacteria bacterium]
MREETRTIQAGGLARTVHFQLPAGRFTGRRPLVIVLHALGATGAAERARGRFRSMAAREGAIVAFPDGIEGRWNYGAPIGRSGPVLVKGRRVRDTVLLRRLARRLVADGRADPARLYLIGISNGAMMAYRVACETPGRFAAIAALVSGMTVSQRSACRPARPVPLLILGGTADRFHAYAGARGQRGVLLSVPATVDFWRRRNRCGGESRHDLADRNREDGSTVTVFRHLGCDQGAEVLFYRIDGGGHRLPGLASALPRYKPPLGWQNGDIDAAEHVWTFFARHRR